MSPTLPSVHGTPASRSTCQLSTATILQFACVWFRLDAEGVRITSAFFVKAGDCCRRGLEEREATRARVHCLVSQHRRASSTCDRANGARLLCFVFVQTALDSLSS